MAYSKAESKSRYPGVGFEIEIHRETTAVSAVHSRRLLRFLGEKKKELFSLERTAAPKKLISPGYHIGA
jgi:hypothetical protein